MSYYARPSGNYSHRSMDNTTNDLLEDIPEYGSAFVCGKSRFEEGKFHVRDDPIIEIACGDEHTGVVTERGRVFMFGSNNWGQLGLGHENNVEKPSCVKAMKHEKVLLIACGRNHTILATDRGNIYTFGSNSEGQLGFGESFQDPFSNIPKMVEKIEPQEWLMLGAGSGHSVALSKSGEVYVWGSNENGEIGLGKVIEQFSPRMVPLDYRVSFIACGYYHTTLISKKGRLYTSGSNEYGQLGHSDHNKRFSEVLSIDEPITFVSCGGQHSVIIGASGRVYSFGDGSKGQLGNGEDVDRSKVPEQITFFRKKKIVQVACGECHSVFITETGEMYASGDNRYGKLGLSQKIFNTNQFNPVLVDKFKALMIENVACGGCHMILIGKLRIPKRNDSDDSIKEKGYSDRRRDLSRRTPSPSPYVREKNRKNSKRKDSDSDEEAEKTFNRTHTLTRDNAFVPLSELNLKKAAEEKSRNRYKNSDNEDERSYQRDRKTDSRHLGTSRNNDDEKNSRFKGIKSNRNRTSSNSDDETFYNSNKKSFLKPPVKKITDFDTETPFLSRPKIKNSDDSDKELKKPTDSPKPHNFRNLSRFNTKSFSDDEIPRSSYLNDRTRIQKPNSTYLRDSVTNDSQERFPRSKRDSLLNDRRASSKTNVRESMKQEKDKSDKKKNEKPKEKPFKICSIL